MCLRYAKIPETVHKINLKDWQVGFYEIKNSFSTMDTVLKSGKISQWLDQGHMHPSENLSSEYESYSIHNQSKELNESVSKT